LFDHPANHAGSLVRIYPGSIDDEIIQLWIIPTSMVKPL
jgi:hypothetical protein